MHNCSFIFFVSVILIKGLCIKKELSKLRIQRDEIERKVKCINLVINFELYFNITLKCINYFITLT